MQKNNLTPAQQKARLTRYYKDTVSEAVNEWYAFEFYEDEVSDAMYDLSEAGYLDDYKAAYAEWSKPGAEVSHHTEQKILEHVLKLAI